jgi:protein-tyrosine phosphatase
MAAMTDHPDRVFPLQGVTNFRDLGGYPGEGGRPLRWRRLFRSDHFGALTEADRAALAPLGIARSFDFRGVAERAATPYHWPGVVQHPLSIEPTVVQRMQDLAAAGRTLTVPVVTDLMADLYRALVASSRTASPSCSTSCCRPRRRWSSTAPRARTAPAWPPR